MKKLILAAVAAVGLFAVAPAPASAATLNGVHSSSMDANARMSERERMMMRHDRRHMERKMMRRHMMRHEMRRDMRRDRMHRRMM